MKWLLLAWRNILRNKRRTLMSCGVIGIGVISILTAVGFLTATFHGLRELTISSELGHLQIAELGQFDSFEASPMELGLPPTKASLIIKELDKHPQVRYYMRRLMFEGLISNGEQTIAFTGKGVEPERETRLSSIYTPMIEGESLPITDDAAQLEIVLATGLAKSLNVKPGDSITLLSSTQGGVLNAIDLRVSGIYKTGLPQVDKRALMVPLGTAQLLLQTDRVSRFIVVLDETSQTATAAKSLSENLPSVAIREWTELAPYYQAVVTLYINIFIVLGSIILLVVLLSSSNSMFMSIMERISEIGTLRAIGLPERKIRMNFLLEGALIGMLGGLIGLIVAALMAFVINLSGIEMPPPPGRSNSYPLIIFIEPLIYFIVLGGICILGAIAAWFPTQVSSRMTIVEALHHN
jgi:putative ABC transport system permease protein